MIYLGADHRGFHLKEKIKGWLVEWGYEFEDVGNTKLEPEDDYVDYGFKVANRIRESGGRQGKRGEFTVNSVSGIDGVKGNKGILICGSGVGMSIVANRTSGVRCGLCTSVEQTIAARKEDDINCLALGVDYVSDEEAKQIVEAFLKTSFQEEERYIRRIGKL